MSASKTQTNTEKELGITGFNNWGCGLGLLHLECSPVCYAAPHSPAADTAPPAPAPGSGGSSSPLPLPPPAAWTTGVRTTLTEPGTPILPGCVLTETRLNRARWEHTAPLRDLQPGDSEAQRAGSSVGSPWRCGGRQRSGAGWNGFAGPRPRGRWWRSSPGVSASPERSSEDPECPLARLPAWC